MFLQKCLNASTCFEAWDGWDYSISTPPKVSKHPAENHYIVLIQDFKTKALTPSTQKTFPNSSVLMSYYGLNSIQFSQLQSQGFLDFEKSRLILFSISGEKG